MPALTLPAIVASFLVTFTLSFDEFILAWFVSGFETTLPVQIWTMIRTGLTPTVSAIGVIIFAVSILILPATLIGAFPDILWLQTVGNWFNSARWEGLITSTLLIVGFTYFYTQISFDPRRISENLREYGGFVPGVRPGQPTTDYLSRIAGRITLWGALFLGTVNALPQVLSWITGTEQLSFAFSGTSLLIMVGVSLDTLRQLESQLMMRHYEGFVSKGRIRGRGRRF